jgi:predicted RNA-binding Zn-ribbon protein involved in translation (DUF1610 family)
MPVTTMKDVSGTYKCDKCKETFEGKDVVLVRRPQNIAILTPGMEPLRTADGSFFACPLCGYLHLWGFDRAT